MSVVSFLSLACSSAVPAASATDQTPAAAAAGATPPSDGEGEGGDQGTATTIAKATGGESVAVVKSCTLPAPPSRSTYAVVEDLVYSSPNGAPQMLDVYAPRTPGVRPLVVLIHGGGWTTGDKSRMRQLAIQLTSLGYVTASVNYRLAADNGVNAFPAPVSDVRCAVRWLRAHAAEHRIDPTRVAALGLSAGAHLAAMLGVGSGVAGLDDGTCPTEHASRSPSIVGAVGYYTPTDFRDPSVWASNDNQGAGVENLLGGPLGTTPIVASLASPITHVSPTTPPFFLAHGTADETVPIEQGRSFVTALQSAGGKATLVELAGVPHGFAPLSPQYPSASCTTLAFLAKVLAP